MATTCERVCSVFGEDRGSNLQTVSHKSNPSPVPRVMEDSYSTLGHVGGGNSCEVYNLMGLLGHTLAKGALVYPSQGGRYCAEGCMALG
jgi:hypothetical protein